MNERACIRCHQTYPETTDYFNRDYSSRQYGFLLRFCKFCQSAQNRVQYQKRRQTKTTDEPGEREPA